MLSVDLESPDGADRPSKAQVGASHWRSGPYARIVARAIRDMSRELAADHFT